MTHRDQRKHRATSVLAVAASAGALLYAVVLPSPDAAGQAQKKSALTFPPVLPDGKPVVTDTAAEFLKPPATLKKDVAVAKTPPTVDFLYYPGQTYAGNPWSAWGDSLATGGKYYASLGDHWSADRERPGNAFVYEYEPATKQFRLLADVRAVLKLPDGHYSPGKIHGRLDLGDDGWLYFATHRGSDRVTNAKYHYRGDWILRCDPATGKAEVVARGPVPKHAIPASVLDPKRLIFYGGTAQGVGRGDENIHFFAYDIGNQKVLYSGPDGPYRALIFARSTGRIYYTRGIAGRSDEGVLMRYHPDENGGKPVHVEGKPLGLRAATQETATGYVYTVSQGDRGIDPTLWSFQTKTEEVQKLGPAAVGSQGYIASLVADPTGRYLYYIPGAHGGSERDDSAVVQIDTKTWQKKVIAFLNPFLEKRYGATLKGTYSLAVDPAGDKLYVTWNVSRGTRVWDCCALTVIHVPESERRP